LGAVFPAADFLAPGSFLFDGDFFARRIVWIG
jgi:hypothetical protein